MKMKYKFTEEDKKKIEEAKKKNRDKQIDKRLTVLLLRCEGMKQIEIVKITGFVRSNVCNIISKYFKEGISSIAEKHYKANHCNMTAEEEKKFLKPYEEQAKQGHILCVKEMEMAYEAKVGHKISSGQIYRLLHRHNWRKVMPRSKHPKKASKEVIEASKKLTKNV